MDSPPLPGLLERAGRTPTPRTRPPRREWSTPSPFLRAGVGGRGLRALALREGRPLTSRSGVVAWCVGSAWRGDSLCVCSLPVAPPWGLRGGCFRIELSERWSQRVIYLFSEGRGAAGRGPPRRTPPLFPRDLHTDGGSNALGLSCGIWGGASVGALPSPPREGSGAVCGVWLVRLYAIFGHTPRCICAPTLSEVAMTKYCCMKLAGWLA